MALTRVLLAWAAAAAWLVAWDLSARRLREQATAARAAAPVPYWVPITEAGWLALLTALWIGSIGAGAWWLVMLLVALLPAWTPTLTAPLPLSPSKRAIALAARTARLWGAGVLAGLLA
jgi:hypothetical protein